MASAAATGADARQVADLIGKSERTAYRRLAAPETRQLIAERRRQVAQEIAGELFDGAADAVRRLRQIVADPDAPAHAVVNAARQLIDLGLGPEWRDGLHGGGHDDQGACLSCGHVAPDPAAKAAAVDELLARLEQMHSQMEEGKRLRAIYEPAALGTAQSEPSPDLA